MLDTAEPHDSKIDSSVSLGDTPTNMSVNEIVTQKPGAYTLTISLVATPDMATPLEIRDTINVTVEVRLVKSGQSEAEHSGTRRRWTNLR